MPSRDELIAQFQSTQALSAAAALETAYQWATETARVRLGAEPYWAFISQDERDKAASSGAAMPDGSYPITTCDGENSVDTAINAVGRGGADHDSIRAHIMKRAESLGCMSKIPDNWNADGSLKDAGSASAASDSFATPPAAPASVPPDGPAPATPADPAKAPADDGEGSPADEAVDVQVSAEIAAAQAAIDRALAAQAKDPGQGKAADDIKVQTDLEAAKAALDKLAADQKADQDAAPAGAPKAGDNVPQADDDKTPAVTAAGPPPAAETTPGTSQGIPGDADDSGPGPGDIEATEQCNNPECGHVASLHENLPDTSANAGANSGACTTPGCNCPGMVPSGQQVNGPGDDGDGAETDTDGSDAVGNPTPGTTGGPIGSGPHGKGYAAEGESFAPGPEPIAAPTVGDPQPPHDGGPDAPEPGAADSLPPIDPMPNTGMGPQFTIPVAWLENTPTGDGRIIDAGAMTWRTPPLPLMFLDTSAHDPSGMSPNDPAVLVGRIETVSVENGTGMAQGHFLSDETSMAAAEKLRGMGRMGLSIDVGAAEVQITADPTAGPSEDVFDVPMLQHLVQGQIMGMTVCPMAAFEGAYIVLGDGTEQPGSLSAPSPEQAAMGIRFVGEQECIPCADGEAGITAAATDRPSLVRPPSAWFANPGFKRGDERLVETIDPKTGKGSGKFACPITVTEDGHVFGHIAQWGVCHQSPAFINAGQCITAPRSRCDYAAFHGTGSVLTAEGELVGVGRMTADTGHAPTHVGVNFAQAVAHYDNSGLTTALVRAGEDEFGIWVSGSLHPSASEEQVFTMRANPPSGDWRSFGAGRELCSVLFVNHPGFPMVKATQDPSSGRISSLVAASVPMFAMPDGPQPELTEADRLARLEAGLAPVFQMARAAMADRMAAVRQG